MSLATLFFLVLAPFAHAQESACIGGHCPGMEEAIRDAFADDGLEIDSFDVHRDAKGATVLTVVSSDLRGIEALAARTGTRAQRLKGCDASAVTVPASFPGIDTIDVPGGSGLALLLPAVQDIGCSDCGPNQSGGCTEICQSTENGVECWYHCG